MTQYHPIQRLLIANHGENDRCAHHDIGPLCSLMNEEQQ